MPRTDLSAREASARRRAGLESSTAWEHCMMHALSTCRSSGWPRGSGSRLLSDGHPAPPPPPAGLSGARGTSGLAAWRRAWAVWPPSRPHES